MKITVIDYGLSNLRSAGDGDGLNRGFYSPAGVNVTK